MKRIVIFLAVAIFAILSVQAQNKDGEVLLPESFPVEQIVFSEAKVTGNKHTKSWFIVRELDFKIGDTLTAIHDKSKKTNKGFRFMPGDSTELFLRLKYSRDNIINTKLFVTVDLTVEQIDANFYRLLIDVTERHYWWIFPVLKLNAPNFNEWLRDPDLADLSMGLFFSENNLFGIGHQTSIVGYVGKSYAAAWGYRVPWIGQGKKTGLTVAAAYQNLYTVEYGSLENKRQMLYEDNSFQNVKVGVALDLRPDLYHYGTLKLSGEWVSISDSLYSLDTNFLAKSEKSNLTMSFYADYAYDNRNSKSYPLSGSYMRAFVNKIGLGLLSKDVDYFYYGIDFHFYQKLSDRWYVAEMFKLENSSGQNHPYYYQLNMSYKDDFIRGYDLFTLKGDEMYYFRNNLKYALVKPSVRKGKDGEEITGFKALQYAFYLNAFADAGYVVNDFTVDNPYTNKMLFSWGLGLDFVTYYDMVFRFEYAFTSIGTNGFFIGFGMGI